ncbi:MAG TPA: DUF4097 family beta strand repeat-containing protein [Holophagaceae bacterium]|nr:DUF4097 family beta strand repeat-containing protein [Holophagaceae bacterium]
MSRLKSLALTACCALVMVAQEPPAPPAPPAPPMPPEPSGPMGPSRIEKRDEPLVAGSKLWIRNRNGAIRVTGWNQDRVSLVAEIRDTENRRVELVLTRKDGDLDIEAQFAKPAFTFGFMHTSPRCEMTLQVPRKLLVHARTVNGTVSVINLEGFARCETTNGGIRVEDVAGEVHADTTNGTIEARRLKARIKAETTNGKVILDEVAGGVQVETTNGSVVASGLDGWGEGIKIETTNGSVQVDLGKATGDLLAENSTGSIEANVKGATVQGEISKHRLHLKVPGRDQKIHIETTNGSIKIR